MALKLLEIYKGIEANYWKITNIQCLPVENITYVTLALYKDFQSRVTGVENYLKTETMNLEGVDYTREVAYEMIKQSKIDESGIEVNKFFYSENV